jgi:hypothetical protein
VSGHCPFLDHLATPNTVEAFSVQNSKPKLRAIESNIRRF